MAEPNTSAFSNYYNYPVPKTTDIPYTSPPSASNPVFRGLTLYYAASIVSSSPFLCNLLYRNAGFTRLRELKALEDLDARYDPTAIPKRSSNEPVLNYTDPQELRAPRKDNGSRYYSVADYHEAYKSGKITPTAVAEALLPLIRRDVEAPTKHSTAFLQTRVDLVKEAAEAATQRYKNGMPLGVLDGVPVAVKDEVDLKGYHKCLGTKVDFTSKLDATSWAVRKWEEQGAIIMGKLNIHELGLDTTNNNPHHGTPLNPHNPNYYTGGSSGGSAYAVSTGLVPFALGADGGGSIRIPSSYCGIFGLKTSHGRVSGRPTPSLATSTGVLGPMAASMTDLEVAYRVMATPDPGHPASSLFPPPRRHMGSRRKVLGICRPWFERADALVREACDKALDFLTTQREYEVVDISLPHIPEGQLAHAITILAEISTSFPAVANLTAPNKVLIAVGATAPATDFLLAQKLRQLLMEHLAALFAAHPGLVIVTPTTPNAGWHISGGANDLRYGVSDANMSVRSMEFVWLANFAGLPSLTFPVGYVEAVEGTGNIPVGLMGTGEWGREDELMEFGFDGDEWLCRGMEGGRRRPEGWVDVLELAAARMRTERM